MIYQPMKPKIETFVLPESFATMFAHDKYFAEYYSPNIYEALSAHSTKYRRGYVDEQMVVNNSPFVELDAAYRSRFAKLDEDTIGKMKHAWKAAHDSIVITIT